MNLTDTTAGVFQIPIDPIEETKLQITALKARRQDFQQKRDLRHEGREIREKIKNPMERLADDKIYTKSNYKDVPDSDRPGERSLTREQE